MKIAAEKAIESRMKIKVGCVLVKQNCIYGLACNEIYQMANNDNKIWESIHAEIGALSKAMKNKKKDIEYEMYIARVRQGEGGNLEFGLAKPCAECERSIKGLRGLRIRRVYYSTGEGWGVKTW